jgi:hypothetical protein
MHPQASAMTDCTHPSHRAHVTVMHPDADNPGFRAKIEIECSVCRTPFLLFVTDGAVGTHASLTLPIGTEEKPA